MCKISCEISHFLDLQLLLCSHAQYSKNSPWSPTIKMILLFNQWSRGKRTIIWILNALRKMKKYVLFSLKMCLIRRPTTAFGLVFTKKQQMIDLHSGLDWLMKQIKIKLLITTSYNPRSEVKTIQSIRS